MFLVSVEGGSGPARAATAEMMSASLRAAEATAAPLLFEGDSRSRGRCGPPMAVLEGDEWSVALPCGTSMRDLAAALSVDWLVAASRHPLGAPVVALDPDAADERAIACWEDGCGSGLPVLGPDTPPSKLLGLLRKRAFPMLPQRDAEECGRCGLDCLGLAGEIVQGRRAFEDCQVASSKGVAVTVGGRRLDLGGFPADLLRRTLRGLLSSLKGYREGASVRIDLD